MSRLIIVSNRLPISVEKTESGLNFIPSVGGLATGLGSIYRMFDGMWIGWPGIAKDDLSDMEIDLIEERLKSESCLPVFFKAEDLKYYYYGFCNKVIWPLFHYFYIYMDYQPEYWRSYIKINELFCEKILEVAQEEDIIWIHDYHLMLLPKLIRESLPGITIGFFLHIPFPSFEVFRLLPCRKEILEGLLGADLIGFHTYDYTLHFITSVMYLLGLEHTFGEINLGERIAKADAFPMGIDYNKFNEAIEDPKIRNDFLRLKKRMGDRKLILSVDRLDYTKGIPNRLEAFDTFLDKYPQYIGKVVMVMVAVPTRTGVEHYMLLKKQVDELVGKINGKYSTIGWTPIIYIYRSLPFHALAVLYNLADVALVTPLRDGMNLIAKEYVASKQDAKGVLILSEFAGAAKELGEALIVNPNNTGELADTIAEALNMPESEQIERNRIMQQRLKRYSVKRWASDFMHEILKLKEERRSYTAKYLSNETLNSLIENFKNAAKKLIILDYDGTLVPFAPKPERALPDEELKEMLNKLSSVSEVVIASGRDRKTLDDWFSDLNVSIIAEHGIWIKRKGKDWELNEGADNSWKQQLRPVLELFVDRTPGSFIEEKEFSLAWHYRKSDPELASVRARDLKNTLLQLTSNLNLQILDGNKVIEIRSAGINKGTAIAKIVGEGWDFILCAGDDITDEDMFSILDDNAYTIKVGSKPTKARYMVRNYREIRNILKRLYEP